MISLFEDVRIVKGYNRSVLHDLTKGSFEFISNETFEILDNLQSYENFATCINLNKEQADELIRLDNLNVINHFVSEKHIFPEIDKTNSLPNHFQAITFIVNESNSKYIEQKIVLLSLLTQNLFLIFEEINLEFVEFLTEFLKDNQHLRIIFCGKRELLDELDSIVSKKKVFCEYSEVDLADKTAYIESFPSLHNNYLLFNENLNYNSGFFEKILVNKDGRIGINLFDDLILGNLQELETIEDFENLKTNSQYQELIKIKVEQIVVCQLCEFRYMCTDIKVPRRTKFSTELFFKEECRYNPFVSKWKHEEGYSSLSDCGVKVNETELIIDDAKIAEINCELWED